MGRRGTWIAWALLGGLTLLGCTTLLGVDGQYGDQGLDAGLASQGGSSQGGSAQGGSAQGGSAQGGSAQGGSAQGGSAQGGSAQGGSAQGGGGQGGCGGACSFPHAAATCSGGQCKMGACDPGYADCDSSAPNGCEVALATDNKHCGQCTTVCPVAPNVTSSCSNSTCALACSSGWKDCDGNLANGCEKSGASYKDTVLSDAPVGYWRLDETSGTTAADASGHGYELTYHGGVNRGISGALTCDPDTAVGFVSSAQSWIGRAPVAALEPTTAISIELWFLQTGTLSANEKLVYYSYYSADPWASWGFQRTGSAQNGFSFQLNLANKAKWLNTTSVTAKDTWYHVVLTYDGAKMSLYLNGALDASMSATGLIGYNHSTYGLAVGAWALPTSYWTGSVDEVAVYDKALSATRIAAHYAAGKL